MADLPAMEAAPPYRGVLHLGLSIQRLLVEPYLPIFIIGLGTALFTKTSQVYTAEPSLQ